MGEEVFAGPADKMRDGDVRIIEHGELEIGLIRHDGQFFAYRNLCPHQGGPACEGRRMLAVKDVIGEDGGLLCQTFDEDDMHIVCPWHGYEYHLSTGVNVADKKLRLAKFGVSERDGGLYVQV